MTLTDAASFTKKAFVFVIIFVILFTISVIAVQAYLKAQKAKILIPEPKPDLGYGALPYPNLAKT